MKIKTLMFNTLIGLPILTMGAVHGIDRANLDPTTSPAENFYQYACGGWMKANPLSPEYSRFGTFDQLRENARLQLKDLITNLGENPDAKVPGTNAQKVCDIYNLGMDSVRLNKEGAAPLKPLLKKVEGLKRNKLTEQIAWMHNGITNSFFGAAVGADPKNSDMNILHIGETGLSLGDRDYYLEENETNAQIMAAYETYVKRVMSLAGYSEKDCNRIWQNLIKLEKGFAANKMTREDRRQPAKRYNLFTIDQLCETYPNIEWKKYFDLMGYKGVDKVNVSSPAFIAYLNTLIPTLTDREIKDYFAYEVVADSSGLLGDEFANADFELYDRVMSGKEEQEPRWKRSMSLTNSMFGEAVGQLYVAKYFPEENKKYMSTMVENLRQVLGKHIDNLTWMSDETKAKAHDKLDTFTVKIGYPDKWQDYSEITIDPKKSYLENVLEASKWYKQDNISKLNKPVDKEEWHMTPQTVNAYYNPPTNEICFPAAILQAPYFDPEADDAQNYGAIGVVIGHEMTHGFDDSGRQYDKDGNLKDWWAAEDATRFNALADKLCDKFNAVEVAPGVNANGRFTLGENIADQGGLRVALTAYLNTLPAEGGEVIDGFCPLQRFYLAYANLWANNIRDEEILQRTKTDPHSLGVNRVNETLKNINPFFEAFGIKEGDAMFRPEEERVIIW